MECSLHRHLDSVEPGTPMRDIVDRCRVWESLAEDTDCWGARPIPNRPLPVYRIDDVGTESGPDVSFGRSGHVRVINATFVADAASVASEGDSHCSVNSLYSA